MPAFGQVLEDKQIRELIKYERAFSQGGPQSAETKEIFEDACAVCHGKSGRGDGERALAKQPAPKYFVSDAQPSPMKLTDRRLMARFNDGFLFS
jgi:mono/diheme cytochrome c family protein